MITTHTLARSLRWPGALVLAVLICSPTLHGATAAREWNEQLLAAIRRNVPNPPAHARNLFHTATAMYDAWAAYDATAVGYLYNEKISPLPADVEAARHEAISYAAYRVLRARFTSGPGSAVSLASFDAKLTELGYSTATAQAALTSATTPAELGKRVGQAILTHGAVDGFSNMTYPQAYDAAVNPNMNPLCAMSVLGNNGKIPVSEPNMPLGVGVPLIANTAQEYTVDTHPNYWQPLALSASVTQNGIPTPGGIQSFVGVQSLATQPFSLTRTDPLKPWIDIGPPSRLSLPGAPSATDADYKAAAMDVLRKSAKLNDDTLVDFSPGAYGGNPLGDDSGTGHAVNPVTGQPYAANMVKRGDFFRVLAEFWADGPNSETPPGHWHVLANQISDNPLTAKKIRGTGPVIGDLEWDVKTYFCLAGAVHDAACEAWSLKRYYSGTRPITMIRYMGTMGQSSDPGGPSYHPQGLPLEAGVVEVITTDSADTGQRHEQIWDVYTNTYVLGLDHIGKIVVLSWPAEHPENLPAPSIATHQSTVRWMFAKDWLPFQRKTFNTPAFPGYTSGHSTFSRAAAEALTLLTGSPSFPGGFHHHTVAANSMQIDLGPSADVDLQWNTYYDAADQAGQSRRWGGIHPSEDDFGGRITGAQVGVSAYTKAEKFWTGTILAETAVPTTAIQPDGSIVVTWNATPDTYNRLQRSTDQLTWTDLTGDEYARTTSGSFTDEDATAGAYYRVVTKPASAARVWNEQLMAAIRRNVPNPPAHARNLFHTAVAMYDSWAAYDPTTAVGYIYNEKTATLPGSAEAIEAARHEAISYAAYRVLRSRFATGAGNATSLASFDAKLTALGYSTVVGQADLIANDPTPAELGKRIGQAILTWGASDGFANLTYPQAYDATVNPNMDPARALPVLGNNGEFPISQPNMPLGVGIPLLADFLHNYTADTDPNFWQPLALSTSVTQNGIPTPGGIQAFVGVQSLATTPFSLNRPDPLKPWIDIGPPSRLSLPGQPSTTDAGYKAAAMDVLRKGAKLNDPSVVDFSPGAYGNNPLGADTGTGHPTNPVTGQPYAANPVKRGDFFRVLAEFWADGPNSETPPGHWHVLANEVSDDPLTVKKIRGTGPTLNSLEWDVKTYFCLSASTHDAACQAWSLKRYYHGTRPITMIRYMGTMGQSSEPGGPSYHPQGLPLEAGVVEVITDVTSAAGGQHEQIWNVYTNGYESGGLHLGKIAVFSWPAEHPDNLPAPSIATNQSTVRWMLASDWLPFQRKTFNTPAFPGYTSGHSTFSRAAAEALTLLTGSSSFPGGFGHHVVAANSMQIDLGPSAAVDLQWNTYYDAADQAGQSRRWGGIHPSEDDFGGRISGSQVGKSAYALAEKYWSGSIRDEAIAPAVTILPGGSVQITWTAVRGMYHKVQTSPDLVNWTDVAPSSRSYSNAALAGDTSGTWTDTTPPPGEKYYRVLRSTSP